MGGIADAVPALIVLTGSVDVVTSFGFVDGVFVVESGSKGFCGRTEPESGVRVPPAAVLFVGSATELDEEWVVIEAASAADFSDME